MVQKQVSSPRTVYHSEPLTLLNLDFRVTVGGLTGGQGQGYMGSKALPENCLCRK